MKRIPWLNGWQRIGVVLSVAWLLAAGSFAAYKYTACWTLRPSDFVSWRVRETESRKPLEVTFLNDSWRMNLLQRRNAGEVTIRKRPSLFLFIFVLSPVALAWFIAYCLLLLVRWIIRGFRGSSHESRLERSRP